MTRTERRRWLALYALCTGMLMIVLDATIVNVALPSIRADLHFSENNLAWVVNAYLIAFGGLLLLGGRVGDLIGPRRMFILGLTVFSAASLACALAQSEGLLIAARFVQGAGGALTSAVILGMIVTMFTRPEERGKAIGIYGFVASAGGSIGLLAGGVLTDAINWHWIFFVNVPLGAATIFATLRLVEPRDGIGLEQGADVPGAGLITAGMMLGIYAILGVGAHGWGSPRTLGLGGLAVALVAAGIVRQALIPNPLIPLRIFRSRNVSGANVVMPLFCVGMFATSFLGALYLQEILGYTPFEVGLAFLPLTVAMGTLSMGFTARLNERFGARATLVPGLVLIGAGLVLFTRSPVSGSYVSDVLPVVLLLGVGAGLATPSLMALAMSEAGPQDAGLASGLINTSVQIGGAFGLAVLTTLATQHTSHRLAHGQPQATAVNSGYHLAYAVAAALVLVAIVVAVSVLRAPAPAPDGVPAPEPA